MLINLIAILIILLISLYIYWRFFYFFRDPIRNTPIGENIISPADGTIIYVKKVKKGVVPICIKKNQTVKLDEIIRSNNYPNIDLYSIGIFMHLTSVHVNRAPISGKIIEIKYIKDFNISMIFMTFRTLFNMRPYEKYSKHIIQNERNIITIQGKILLYMVQIADKYVNKIICSKNVNDNIIKGEKIGAIKMGSQVDVIMPIQKNIKIAVKEGEKVKAGESILANFISE